MEVIVLEDLQNLVKKKHLIDPEQIKLIVNKYYLQLCQNEQVEELEHLLKNYFAYVDLDYTLIDDIDKSTGLTYAACYGYYDVAKTLIKYGADINKQDNSIFIKCVDGWSPLMWASNNKNQSLVDLLLENEALLTQKTIKGRTVIDLINFGLNKEENKNQKLNQIINSKSFSNYNKRKSMPVFDNDLTKTDSSSFVNHQDYSFEEVSFHSLNALNSLSNNNNILGIDQEESFLQNVSVQLQDLSTSDNPMQHYERNVEGLQRFTDKKEKEEFVWDQCLSDQMLVFDESNIANIILKTITLATPKTHKEKNKRFMASNVIFLCARYAFYYNTPELLDKLMQRTILKLKEIIKLKQKNLEYMSFWLSNILQLLFYFKKDHNLINSSAKYQMDLVDLINDVYMLICKIAQYELNPYISLMIVSCETSNVLKSSSNTSKLSNFMNKFKKNKVFDQNKKPQDCINNILCVMIVTLKTYNVHPNIIMQVFEQILYFISSSIFNLILTNKKTIQRDCCILMKMHLTDVMDFIRNRFINNSNHNLMKQFSGLNQLLLVVQLLSTINNETDFIDLLASIAEENKLYINKVQINHIIKNYQYQPNETKIKGEIIDFIANTNQYFTSNNNILFLDQYQMLSFKLPTQSQFSISSTESNSTSSFSLNTQSNNDNLLVPCVPDDFVGILENNSDDVY